MKYLKSYKDRDSDGLSYADKVKILESCYPISTQSITDICQNILDDYDSDHIHIQDSVYYTNNKKMSGVSSGYLALENYIERWRLPNSEVYSSKEDLDEFDKLWDMYLESTSKIGTAIFLVFHNMGYQSTDEYPKINDLERELKKITRKIEAEVGEGNVEFMFDWAYPGINRHGKLDSLRAENKYVTDYTLFISYPKKERKWLK